MVHVAKVPKTLKRNDKGASATALGIGAYIPENMPLQHYRLLRRKWDDILRKSGFHDIEIHASDHSGTVSPLFNQNSIEKNRRLLEGGRSEAFEGYFDYCSTYYEHCDFRATFNKGAYGRRWKLYKELFRLHKDGVSYGDMTIALQGRSTQYMKRFNIAPVTSKHLKQKRSKFWLFKQVELILAQMWLWHATDVNGDLTPYDLKYMNVTGLTDVVRAEAFKRGKALEPE